MLYSHAQPFRKYNSKAGGKYRHSRAGTADIAAQNTANTLPPLHLCGDLRPYGTSKIHGLDEKPKEKNDFGIASAPDRRYPAGQ